MVCQGILEKLNSFYEDVHKSVGKFDFVMANPPFNVKRVDYEKVRGDPRWPFGLPSTDNANYLWIQLFYSALNERGRAGFVMANSAADARGAELEIRKKMIEANSIDIVIGIGSNFFYTVTLPCTLWFLDINKRNTNRNGNILFIDARNIFRQVDKAHRDFDDNQIRLIAEVVRSFRKENGSKTYENIRGFCYVATFAEIEEQGLSLNPGRYVGSTEQVRDDFDFKDRLETLNQELENLNEESSVLEESISSSMKKMLESR